MRPPQKKNQYAPLIVWPLRTVNWPDSTMRGAWFAPLWENRSFRVPLAIHRLSMLGKEFLE